VQHVEILKKLLEKCSKAESEAYTALRDYDPTILCFSNDWKRSEYRVVDKSRKQVQQRLFEEYRYFKGKADGVRDALALLEKPIYSRKEIADMSSDEYDAKNSDITDAIKEGRIV